MVSTNHIVRAAGPRVVSSAYCVNLIIYGDPLALIAFHSTSTWRKHKQLAGQSVPFRNCIDLAQQTDGSNQETKTFEIIQLICP